MRRVQSFIILVLALAPLSVLAQYSNNWINFSQPYFKIPIARDGVYRLRYSDLQAAGFPVSSDPRFIQLFHRGKEQSIYVKGQADAVFDASDYIEFYGQKNDGTLDSLLYKPTTFQPHRFYNLYSDTTAYFLTYNSSLSRGIRMDSVQLVNVNNLPAESFQYTERLFVFHNQYSAGITANDVTQSTNFDQGEGWTGTAIAQGNSIDYTIDSVNNTVPIGGNPKLEMLLVGRDAIAHAVQVFVGANTGSLRVLASPNFNNFETFLINTDLAWSDVGANGKILVRIVAQSATTNRAQVSTSYIKITFPQNFDLTGITKKKLELPVNPGGESYVVISNPPPNLKLIDITDLQNLTRILPASLSSTFNVVVPATSAPKKLWASNQFITTSIIPVSFRQIDPSSANYIIITNRLLMKPGLTYSDPVQAFAAYRASTAGGGYDTLTISMDQLYNQFNYGETSPLGIYSFMRFIVPQGNVKYLFLIGKGRDINYSPYQRLPLLPSEFPDLVPSAGYPGADIAYTAGLKGTTYEPTVPTGRLTATTPAEVAAYLNKVK